VANPTEHGGAQVRERTTTASYAPSCCILGATGFIGGQIARAAVNRGWQVCGVRRNARSSGAVGDLPIHWRQADLESQQSLVEAMRDCPVLFHAAGFYPSGRCRTRDAVRFGVRTIRNVLLAASEAGVGRIVYTSSMTTIGPPQDSRRFADESDLYVPSSLDNPYYEAKWAMEMEALRAAARGVPVLVVLPTAVLGPGDIKPSTGALLIQAALGHVPFYVDAPINVVDVRDVAEGQLAAAERGQIGHRYILGGHNVTVRTLLATIAQVAGRSPQRIRVSTRLAAVLGHVGVLLGIPGSYHASALPLWQPLNNAPTRVELGLSEPTPLVTTCRDALEWFREQGYLADDSPSPGD
jgi:dihydroflavonol-4-reductase